MPTSAAAKKAPASPRKRTSTAKKAVPKKQLHYVLDTNVLLHDPQSLYRFKEHDVYLPLIVLEELDKHKTGLTDLARTARTVTRMLGDLLSTGSLQEGFPLEGPSNGLATGTLHFRDITESHFRNTKVAASISPFSLEASKPDNQILGVAMLLIKEGLDAVLVTKDVNLRVKALACDVPAQDYRSDHVLSDTDVLPTGFVSIDLDFWTKHQFNIEEPFWREGNESKAEINTVLPLNTRLLERKTATQGRRMWRVTQELPNGSILTELIPLQQSKKSMLEARNDEQALGLQLLRDKSLDAISILGKAGSGKTLITLAAALEQVNDKEYDSIIITRATVAVGEEIGFLPGTEADKMAPWIGGTLKDCFEVLKLEEEHLRAKVEIASMAFMRGRSFHNKFIIIDEAQNLTIRQVKTLITRASQGSKVVLIGNLGQIDTPYLTEASSGLTYAAKKLSAWDHGAHLILPKCERSRLAAYFEDADEEQGG